MKKQFLTVIIAVVFGLGCCITAKAQDEVTSPTFNLTIDLSAEVMSIDLSGAPDVVFTYATAADYNTTQTVTKEGHVTVVSNEPYDLAVRATTAFTVATGDASPLPLEVVNVAADAATLNGGTAQTVSLSNAAQAIVNRSAATLGNSFNITYSIPDASSLLDREGDQYTTTVVYVATQI